MTEPQTPDPSGARHRRVPAAKLGALLLAVVAAGWLVGSHGVPTATEVRELVGGAGSWAPAFYVLVFAVLTLVAAPRNVLTTVGAALFGVAGGIALSWLAALIGAVAGFAVGRWLGAEAVERLTRGRLDRVSIALRDHGLESVVAARLMPVVPFTAVSYGAGVLGVRFVHFAVGTAVGIVPGTIAYAVLGAYALDAPWALAAIGAGLLVLFLAGTVAAPRLRPRGEREQADCRHGEPESVDVAL